ncbi:hypothetical protein VNO78_15080 [Psophocarpus tetragonolobus]|uniref:Homeobox domain-containing protein n=1 Tax=Psophocarpus tetragonolobus TaxID=3891 RepID=A0AAN9SFB6_PSOTE
MSVKDDDFGLSLSLSLGVNQQTPPFKLNHHMHHPQPQPQQPVPVPLNHNNTLFGDLFPLPDRSSDIVRGINVNSAAECDEENGVSSPNSAVSSVSGGKRGERDYDNAAAAAGERTSCSRGSDDEDGGGGDAGRKKLRLTKEQSMVLEETFKEHNTLNPKRKQALAEELNLKPRQVEVWFQNRRARTKLKQTEVDCEYLKRCCENLTEENRRLHKEVQELRALKLSPQMYMHMNPPTTLTMCPSCERAHASASSTPATVHSAALPSNRRRPAPVTTWPFDGSIHRP